MTSPVWSDRIRAFLTQSAPETFVLRLGGESAAEGESMTPRLQNGDSLFVRRVEVESLCLGDVVVFYRDDWTRSRVHRLIWKRRRGGRLRFYAKGDALPNAEYFEADALVGRVEEVKRDGRVVSDWKRARLALALVGCARFLLARAWYRVKILLGTEESV